MISATPPSRVLAAQVRLAEKIDADATEAPKAAHLSEARLALNVSFRRVAYLRREPHRLHCLWSMRVCVRERTHTHPRTELSLLSITWLALAV
jgi:hypothetical protein